jgi:hypothetical protein
VLLDHLLAGLARVGVDPEGGDPELPSQRDPRDRAFAERLELGEVDDARRGRVAGWAAGSTI